MLAVKPVMAVLVDVCAATGAIWVAVCTVTKSRTTTTVAVFLSAF